MMMFAFLRPFWLVIAKWAVIASALAVFLFRVRQSGKEAEHNRLMRETLRGVQIRGKIEEDVGALDDAERKRLHDKWTKD